MKELETVVGDAERITRFIFSDDHYSAVNQRVKYGAFMPAPDGKASVYRTSECSEEEIGSIDQEHVSGKRTDGRKSKARADILAGQVREVKLDIVSEPSPHPRHANIERYSSDKSENRIKAMEMAKGAILIQKVSLLKT